MNKQTADQVTAAITKSDAELYAVAAKQMAFKPGVVTNLMLDLVEQLRDDRIKWGDEFTLTASKADCNCVGTAFKQLSNIGLVHRMEQHRRSTKDGQKGRLVWKYRLANAALAATFLRVNKRSTATKGQPELAL